MYSKNRRVNFSLLFLLYALCPLRSVPYVVKKTINIMLAAKQAHYWPMGLKQSLIMNY
jgi:hypothetical protein